MTTVNGLNEAQVQELLTALHHDTLIEDDGRQKRLRHEYIRAQLTRIFGLNGWGEQNLTLEKLYDEEDKQAGFHSVGYAARQRLIIRASDGSVQNFFDGAGAWGSETTNKERTPIAALHSDAMNGAMSVALRRAAINLGDRFGLSLYTQGDPYIATVGYSLPHLVFQQYRAGDGEQQELPEGEDIPA